MRAANALVAEVLAELATMVAPNVFACATTGSDAYSDRHCSATGGTEEPCELRAISA